MKKKNIKKGRLATYTIFGLASVSLIAVGFSAWIVQTDIVVTLDEVTVQVAEVDNQIVQILEAEMTDGSFKLEPAKDDDVGPIVSDGENYEDLSLGFVFQWAIEDSPNFNGINYRLIATETIDNGTGTQITDPTLSDFVETNGDTLITFPGRFIADDDDDNTDILIPVSSIGTNGSTGAWEVKTEDAYYTVSSSTGLTQVTDEVEIDKGNYNIHVHLNTDAVNERFTATVVAKFSWGSAFDYKNPSLFATNENVNTVETNLNTLKNGIDGKKFAFELTHPA